mmetsp:Transcript_25683/g.25489  ORF Transcript_25683/g.25489 Transcript_25683/m.25489 type:complete len:317 (+) Transcript_25683:659-1609(+)
MKTKHQSGTDNNQLLLNSGRGRGRPKKNAGRVTTIAPESDDYFKTLDKGGGPTDPLYFFNEIVQKFFINKNPNTKKEIEIKQESPAAPEEKKAANSAQNSDVKEEVTANDKNSKAQENTEEQQKILNDHNHLSKEGEHSDVKEEVEESKSESQAKSQNKDLYDSSKNSNFKADFKQFSFKSYTDVKDYPFYEILSKKSLFPNKEGEVPKEVKEEQAEERPENDASKDIEMDEQEKQAKSEPKPKDEAIHDASMEDNIEVKSERRENTTPNEDEEEKIKEEPQNEENLFRKKRYDQVLEDYQKLTFNQKQELSCDEV